MTWIPIPRRQWQAGLCESQAYRERPRLKEKGHKSLMSSGPVDSRGRMRQVGALVIVRLQDTSVSSFISKEPFLKWVWRTIFSSVGAGDDPRAWPCWVKCWATEVHYWATWSLSNFILPFFVWGFCLIVLKQLLIVQAWLAGNTLHWTGRQVSRFQRSSCAWFPSAETISVSQHTKLDFCFWLIWLETSLI